MSEVPAPERRRAGFVSRAAADLLDVVLVSVATLAVALTAAMLGALFTARRFAFPRPGGLAAAGWVLVAFVVYLTFFWATTGRTPGKQVSGLRVVTSHGEPLGLPRAAIRAVVCALFPLGFAWVVVSPRNRAVHDVLLGTAVVYDWPQRTPRGLSTPAATVRRQRVGA